MTDLNESSKTVTIEEVKEKLNLSEIERKYSEIGGFIPKNVIFIDEHDYIRRSLAILRTCGNLRLTGETGTGKTTLVYKLAEVFQKHLFEQVLTRDISRWDLLACDTLKEGNTKARKGIIVKWLESEEGGILYLDGFNYAENGIVSLLESLSDFRGNVYIPELEKTYKRTPNHYLVISFNPTEKTGYSGTFIQNIATMRRFEGLIIDYLSITEETKLIKTFSKNYEFARKFVEIANKTRKLYKESKLRTPLTTGNLINYAKLWKDERLTEEEIIQIAKSLYPDDEWSMFERLYEENAKFDIGKEKAESESD